ncbi:MAG: M28 family peptidase [Gemmatimonadota bacterium]
MMRGLLPLMLFVLAGCPSAGQEAGGNTAAQSNAPPLVADSAYQHIRTQVAFGPRVPNTDGHRKQLEWMLAYLRERADTVTTQSWTQNTTMGAQLALTNVFARFNPSAADRVLLLAHWDTRPTADEDGDESKRGEPISGANDGASGTALLLEIANVLSKHEPPIGVDLLFVDGEDYAPNNMYLGAKYFAANLPSGYRPLYGILVDMIADQNPAYPIESNSKEMAPEVVDRVWRTAEELGLGNHFRRSSQGAIEDDHMPLNRAGIRTINIIDFDYGPGNSYWHTSADVLENTSPRGLGVVGTVLLELIFRGG